jgi:hypothetical protein
MRARSPSGEARIYERPTSRIGVREYYDEGLIDWQLSSAPDSWAVHCYQKKRRHPMRHIG